MSRLRAKCPDCRTYTAVALGPEYQCHACGREFGAGLVRVPRAWGKGGEAMTKAARLPFPYPETAVVEEDSLSEQTLAVASDLPERPLIVGGCCCAHIGAVEALAARHGRLAVIWLDAHGDLNTPETSPSGNLWGMPLRMVIDGGAVDPADVALVGARSLDPPEEEFIAASALHIGADGVERALQGTTGAYVALDTDSLDPAEGVRVFMPEPDGLRLADVDALFHRVREQTTVLGAGITACAPDARNVKPLERLMHSLGL